ncbi:unnamed protein product, partial [Dovyalis caffra]
SLDQFRENLVLFTGYMHSANSIYESVFVIYTSLSLNDCHATSFLNMVFRKSMHEQSLWIQSSDECDEATNRSEPSYWIEWIELEVAGRMEAEARSMDRTKLDRGKAE